MKDYLHQAFLLGEAFLVSVEEKKLGWNFGIKYTWQNFISKNKTSTEHAHTHKKNCPRLDLFSIFACVFLFCFALFFCFCCLDYNLCK